MIQPSDITGVDATVARRIIAVARSIAPFLDSLVDGGDGEPQPKADAIAIIQGVAADIVERGARSIKSQSVTAGRVEYVVGADSFSSEDRAALRALRTTTTTAVPIGSFPADRPISRVWPEKTTAT